MVFIKRFSLLAVLCVSASAISITTAHVDNSRDGWNSSETKLTPALVSSGQFGLRGRYVLDGVPYAQPLIVENVTIGGASYTVMIICTMHNTCYAFDALRPGSTALWSTNFGASLTSYPDQMNSPLMYGHEIGCLSTPVVDQPNGLLYSVCSTNTPTWVLRKIDITTGTVLSSVTVTGQVVGTGDIGHGDTTSGANLIFYPTYELQRSALTLANGNVYVEFGSYADNRPWHGWAMAYDATSLSQVGIYCSSPNVYGAGLWGSSGGFSVDGSGNLYMLTGNGTYDGITAFGESILKFNSTLSLTDWFTPTNWAVLDGNDSDLSSGRAMLIPGTSKYVSGAKDYNVYSGPTICMGQLGGTVGGCTAPQIFPTNSMGVITDHSGIYGGAYANGEAFFPNTNGKIYKYVFSGGTFNTTPTVSAASYEYPGAQMSVSSNGASSEIVWATTTSINSLYQTGFGTLRALNPVDLSEYWNSDSPRGNELGTLMKFSAPVVANGSVFVSTFSEFVDVYGLYPATTVSGPTVVGGPAVIQ